MIKEKSLYLTYGVKDSQHLIKSQVQEKIK